MSRQILTEKLLAFFFENKVALMFSIICLAAFFVSGMSTSLFFGELATRFGRNSFLVLSLLIPVIAGLGLNFGMVLGAMAAQISIFLIIVWGGIGTFGVFAAATVATPIAVLFGYLVGKMFNSMKGSEMIGGMVTGFFADGFYQFLFLFVFGGLIPIANERLMTSTGVGVLNAVDLDGNYMRQALDNVPMLNILDVAFWAVLIFTVATVIFKLIKKQPLEMFGSKGLIKLLVVLIPLALAYLLSFIFMPFHYFLYQDRLVGWMAVDIALIGMALYWVYRLVREKFIEKQPGVPFKPVAYLVLVIILYLLTLHPEIYAGLNHVQIPVLTYLLIVGLCFLIKWFMNTRLGQNMRTVGQNRAVATAAGINVDRTRIIAMILSTLLAAYGQIIVLQNFGVMITYGSHLNIALYAIAALLVGGATVSRASVKHALTGVILFHALFILAPIAGTQLMGSALIGEYFRMFVAYAIIAVALIMHAWQRTKSNKAKSATA
ncbi:MAG: ABC transporter permease [Defluviitaleaceae bacterium]|nr:ABC transporter permease [Defluviitaleaceae bacterium]